MKTKEYKELIKELVNRLEYTEGHFIHTIAELTENFLWCKQDVVTNIVLKGNREIINKVKELIV